MFRRKPSEPATAATEPGAQSHAAPAKSKLDILIVEDSPTQAILLEQILVRRGFRVESARHGRDALVYLQELSANPERWEQFRPDLILSDIVMPAMDGFALCLELKQHEIFKSIPLILMTSLNNSKEAVRGLYSGADNLLAKPLDEAHLLATLDMMLTPPKPEPSGDGERQFAVNINGRKYLLTEDRLRLINMIYTTYETAVRKNLELEAAQQGNLRLERELYIARQALSRHGISTEELDAHQLLVGQR